MQLNNYRKCIFDTFPSLKILDNRDKENELILLDSEDDIDLDEGEDEEDQQEFGEQL